MQGQQQQQQEDGCLAALGANGGAAAVVEENMSLGRADLPEVEVCGYFRLPQARIDGAPLQASCGWFFTGGLMDGWMDGWMDGPHNTTQHNTTQHNTTQHNTLCDIMMTRHEQPQRNCSTARAKASNRASSSSRHAISKQAVAYRKLFDQIVSEFKPLLLLLPLHALPHSCVWIRCAVVGW
jgi:hypothetical protein